MAELHPPDETVGVGEGPTTLGPEEGGAEGGTETHRAATVQYLAGALLLNSSQRPPQLAVTGEESLKF